MTVALVAIVKNERAVLPRLFDSVRGLVDAAIILDTGSSDGTVDWLLSSGHGFEVVVDERPWENMAVNRSQVLAMARAHLEPDAWLLLLDADMTVEGTIPESVLSEQLLDGYHLRIPQGSMEFWVPRLISNRRSWKYEGYAHEYLTPVDGGPVLFEKLPDLTVHHHADGANRPEKWQRSCAALEQDLREHPERAARTTFYLANNYRDMGRTAEAVEMYRARVELGGWAEEVYYSQLWLGRLTGSLQELLKAHWMRPSRREALTWLSRLAAQRAAATPPSKDLLFVDNTLPHLVDWAQAPGYGTHLPALVQALGLGDGPVLEWGAGDWSTPFLHQLVPPHRLVTVETDAAWRERFERLPHAVVPALTDEQRQQHWGVVLVDGTFESRAEAMALDADVFVVHDTQPGVAACYPGMAEALAGFRYRKDFTDRLPHTTLVSNTKELP